MKGYEYKSDFARKYVAQGRAEGRAEEAARALLTVLRARGIAVPDAVRERIQAQKDPERLERWLEKAVVCLFGRRGRRRTELTSPNLPTNSLRTPLPLWVGSPPHPGASPSHLPGCVGTHASGLG